MIDDEVETYDQANARMASALGPRAYIESVAGTIGGRGSWGPPRKEADEAPLGIGPSIGGWEIRSEPPDVLQFEVDEKAKVVTVRVIGLGAETANVATSAPVLSGRTFYCQTAGADVYVSGGAINNIVVAPTTISAPSDGDKIYIAAEVDGAGETIGVTVSSAATVPTNTTTHGYTLLSTVAVSAGVATPNPLAWNYSQMQKCGSTHYLWGGFGA